MASTATAVDTTFKLPDSVTASPTLVSDGVIPPMTVKAGGKTTSPSPGTLRQS